MRCACKLFIIGELLLLNWLVSGAIDSKTTGQIYELLPWLRQRAMQLPPENFYEDPGPPNEPLEQGFVNPSSKFSLTEDIFYDEKPPVTGEKNSDKLYKSKRSSIPEYRSLCETVTRKVELADNPDYEYQPPHYYEVFCKSYSLMDDEPQKIIEPSKQKCAHPSFHCVQRSRTLFMVRRRWSSECWEPITKVVASGCDCMWPVSILGDISIHY